MNSLVLAQEANPDPVFLEPLVNAGFELLLSSDLDKSLVDELDAEFELPRQKMLRDDIFGVVEQLICVFAVKFMGTNFSTFTQLVYDTREPSNRPYLLGGEFV